MPKPKKCFKKSDFLHTASVTLLDHITNELNINTINIVKCVAAKTGTEQMCCMAPVPTAYIYHLPGKLKGAELNGSSAKSVYVITRLSRLLTLEIPTIFIMSLKTWPHNLK